MRTVLIIVATLITGFVLGFIAASMLMGGGQAASSTESMTHRSPSTSSTSGASSPETSRPSSSSPVPEGLAIVSVMPRRTPWGWNLTMLIKNTGSTTATIEEIYINKKPVWKTGSITGVTVILEKDTIAPGEETTITILFNRTAGADFVSGQTLDVTIHTTTGHDYPKAVILP